MLEKERMTNKMSQVEEYIKDRSAKSVEFQLAMEQETKIYEMADLITSLRKAKGLSQTAFAKLVGKPRSTIIRIENADMNPTFDLITEIVAKSGYKITYQLEPLEKEARN